MDGVNVIAKNKAKSYLFKTVALLLILIVGCVAVFLMSSANSEIEIIADVYATIDNPTNNSKANFTKNLEFITNSSIEYENGGISMNPAEEDVASLNGLGETPYVPDGSWYTEDIKIAKATNGAKFIGDSRMQVYNGLPWDLVSGCYFFDAVKAVEDTYNFINSVSTVKLDDKSSKNARTIEQVKKGFFTTTEYFKASYLTSNSGLLAYKYRNEIISGSLGSAKIDGVQALLIAAPPSVFVRDYCDNFQSSAWETKESASDSYLKDRKCAAVLKDKNGEILYLPCISGDAKGHTFPGGASQTHIKARGKQGSLYKVKYGEKGITGTGVKEGTVKPEELGNLFLNVNMDSGHYAIKQLGNVLEVCYSPGSDWQTKFNNKYTVIGYIVWPN